MMFTPDGDWLPADSERFLAALGDPEPDYDATSFAVRNLGFIRFEVFDQSLIEIELHPRNVQLPALLAVQQQLLSAPHRLFRIRYLEEAWHSEISASAKHTINRLSELCAPAPAPAPSERFIVEPRDISLVFNDETNELRPLAQKWRISFGQFDPTVTTLALRHDLLSRLMIIGVKPHDHEPRFRFIGDGHRWMGNYSFKGIGEKVENQPDREYGAWIGDVYRSVAAAGQPRYDLVTAILQYENEAGTPRRRVRYERLLLPWKTPSDEVFVTLCSKIAGNPTVSRLSSSAPDNSPARNSANSTYVSSAGV
jgi:hypothetical protein